MDDYEGVAKGYYERKRIRVRLLAKERSSAAVDSAPHETDAWVYCMLATPPSLRVLACQPGRALSEYSLDLHLEQYRAIRHIQVKQQLHLSESVGTPAEH